LKIKGLKKGFGGLMALNGLHMEVNSQTMTLLIGPNGSGKTTLINVVCGVYSPDSGRVQFNGVDITGFPPHRIYERGIVRTFQIPHPFTNLSVLENLLTAYRAHPGETFLRAPLKSLWHDVEKEAMRKATTVMKQLELAQIKDSPAHECSGGQMKLLEIGRALMSGATMILIDEPIAGINPVLAHKIMEQMTQLVEKLGITFLYVEHRLDIALQYAHQIFALASGEIIAQGSPDIVTSDPRVIESYLGA
ncbi:MAG: ABC transporter ATP-binding protein, partial [Candidatus Geothermarchaeales archaeon]